MSPSQQTRTDPVLYASFPLLAVFLFAVFTGLPEFLPVIRSMHPLLLIGGIGLIAVFLTGRFRTVVMTPVGQALVLFSIWFVACIPTSVWKGGSFQTFMDYWLKSFLAFVMVAGMITTMSQVRKTYNTIAYAIGFLSLLTLRYHNLDRTGRLSLLNTRYANANALGFILLLGLPFLAYMYMRGGQRRRILAVILIPAVLLTLAKTGSRGSMIGALVLMGSAYFQASKKTRAKMALGIPVVVLALMVVLSGTLRARYTTLFDAQSGTALGSAAGSAQERWHLLKDSVLLTLQHPIFGIGPGEFQVAQNSLAVSRGAAMGSWHETHNTYTQLSSETGIPGLIFYCLFLYRCWKMMGAIIRTRYEGKFWVDLRLMTRVLRTAMLVAMVVTFFDSYAYEVGFPILGGLVVALSFIARKQLAIMRESKPEEQPVAALPEPEYQPVWSAY